jgi:hypothetical protein
MPYLRTVHPLIFRAKCHVSHSEMYDLHGLLNQTTQRFNTEGRTLPIVITVRTSEPIFFIPFIRATRYAHLILLVIISR